MASRRTGSGSCPMTGTGSCGVKYVDSSSIMHSNKTDTTAGNRQ
jgi:hypothetical protein